MLVVSWWMIAIAIAVTGLWSEWRYYKGLSEIVTFNVNLINTKTEEIAKEAYALGITTGSQQTVKILLEKNLLLVDKIMELDIKEQ